ncbi:MAG: right-handed parallel beta-helix repeat-containing protein [Planctomycetota bacterium]|jgi:hypothetical protein
MRLVVFTLVILAVPSLAFSATIYVPDDYTKIQDAIDAAANGDTILVREGYYLETIDFIGKAVTLTSELGPGVTFIDANLSGSVVTCQSGEGVDTVLDGFTLTGGLFYTGGGMYNMSSSPTVSNCIIIGCTATDIGGGMYNINSSPTVNDCFFFVNSADDGGGICNLSSSNPTITNCYFSGNTASHLGGAMLNGSSPTMTNCTFVGNSAPAGGAIHNGSASSSPVVDRCYFFGNKADNLAGAMYNDANSTPTVTNTIFVSNTSDKDAGGMFNDANSTVTVMKCTFSRNSAYDYGGGMYNYDNSATTVSLCDFYGNSTTNPAGGGGGGMYNNSTSLLIEESTFSENSTHGKGAGMFNESNCDPTVTDCAFIENSADQYGGGMCNFDNSNPAVTDCSFEANYAYTGGGMANESGSDGVMVGCTFSLNSAYDYGGAVYNLTSNPSMKVCCFLDNTSHQYGGAMHNNTLSDPLVVNCTFTGNSTDLESGGAICNSDGSSPSCFNCTFYDNTANKLGGAFYNYNSDPTMTNCILRMDNPNEITNIGTSNPDATYNCVQGGYPGTGNIDADPHFVDEANRDFHLLYTSPCRNTGDNTAVTELEDFESDPRVTYGTVDMGVDEFYIHLYCTGDATPGGEITGYLIGLPGASPVGIYFGSGILEPPFQTAWGSFHLQAPWLFMQLYPIPADGVLIMPAEIPLLPEAPYDVPMQALIGLDPDSLSNLFVLEVRSNGKLEQ